MFNVLVDFDRLRVNPVVAGSIFLGTVRLFFEFFNASKGPLQIFDILQQTGVSERPKGLPSYIFRHYDDLKFDFSKYTHKLFFSMLPEILT